MINPEPFDIVDFANDMLFHMTMVEDKFYNNLDSDDDDEDDEKMDVNE